MIEGQAGATLFCREDDPALVVEAIRCTGATAVAVEAAQDWKEITIVVGPGSMRVVRRMFRARMFRAGSEFSRVILGAHAAVREAVADAQARATVLSVLEDCNMMLGIEFVPPLADADPRAEALFAVAAATGSFIFEGAEFLDSSGELILRI